MTGSLSRGLSAVALALALASCTETVDCDVLHLSRLSPPAGERITVVAEDGQARSLEFAGYRALVENELRRVGYSPVASPPAALEARMSYSLQAAPSRREVYWPSCSYHYHFVQGQPLYPDWRIYDCQSDPFVTDTPQFLRELRVTIGRAGAGANEPLFEGQVRSVGGEDHLNEVMPYLVTAMFQNFPGESGKWKTVTISRDKLPPQPGQAEPRIAGGESCPR